MNCDSHAAGHIGHRILPLEDQDEPGWVEREEDGHAVVMELLTFSDVVCLNTSQWSREEIEHCREVLHLRHTRMTEAVIWEALRGEITYHPKPSQKVVIDYGFPLGHKPTTAVPWSDHANSHPQADIASWIGDIGVPCEVIMNRTTATHAIESKQLNFDLAHKHDRDRSILHDLATELDTTIYINDAGLIDSMTDESVRYVRDGEVFVVADRARGADPIGETVNGYVWPWEGADPVIGPYIQHHNSTPEHDTPVIIAKTARIPYIEHKEHVIYARTDA